MADGRYDSLVVKHRELLAHYDSLQHNYNELSGRVSVLLDMLAERDYIIGSLKLRLSPAQERQPMSVGRPRLSDKVRLDIFELLLRGYSQRRIAGILGLSKSAVAKYGKKNSDEYRAFLDSSKP